MDRQQHCYKKNINCLVHSGFQWIPELLVELEKMAQEKRDGLQ